MLDDRKPQYWYRLAEHTVTEVLADRFEFRADKKWHWLQRLCFWVLRKIGAHAEAATTVYQRWPQENDDLLASLIGQHEAVLEYAYRTPCRIYIGPEQNLKLMRQMHDLGWNPITLDAQIKVGSRRGYKFLDIPVIVVPWLDGAFIVPVE